MQKGLVNSFFIALYCWLQPLQTHVKFSNGHLSPEQAARLARFCVVLPWRDQGFLLEYVIKLHLRKGKALVISEGLSSALLKSVDLREASRVLRWIVLRHQQAPCIRVLHGALYATAPRVGMKSLEADGSNGFQSERRFD